MQDIEANVNNSVFSIPPTFHETLSRRVYEELKRRLNEGSLKPGEFIDLKALDRELGMSRTPLRDALIRLEIEGFITVYPRRGVMVRQLGLREIRELYEMIGALEAQAAISTRKTFSEHDAERMNFCNKTMVAALERDDFSTYYDANLDFHNVYIEKCNNRDLIHAIKVRKERLYDFPRRSQYIRNWELASVDEHSRIALHFRERDFHSAAMVIRDIHWSYEYQEPFIRAYYSAAETGMKTELNPHTGLKEIHAAGRPNFSLTTSRETQEYYGNLVAEDNGGMTSDNSRMGSGSFSNESPFTKKNLPLP